MSSEQFKHWIDVAYPGQVYVYYTGGRLFPLKDIDILDLAFENYLNGKLHLFQRKLHDDEFDYIAMKRSRYLPTW